MGPIVKAVTKAVEVDADQYWAVEFSYMHDWQRDEFMLHCSADEASSRSDEMRMEILTKNPGRMKAWA